MRPPIRWLLFGALCMLLARHVAHWPLGQPALRPNGTGWWSALSFALAAVVDPDRTARG